MADLYDILGVTKVASQDDIKQAFRRLVLIWHPDVRSSAERELATEKMEEINAAYATLSQPTRRKEYDRSMGIFRCSVHHKTLAVEHCSVCGLGICGECLLWNGKALFCPSHAPDVAQRIEWHPPAKQKRVQHSCWIHVGTAAATSCKLCGRWLCTDCVVFIKSDRYCDACSQAVYKAREELVMQNRKSVAEQERDAMQRRQQLRTMMESSEP